MANTDFSSKVQDAIISDVFIYPEMDISRTVWHFSEQLSSILRAQSGKGLLKKDGRAFRNIGKKYNPDSNISLASFV